MAIRNTVDRTYKARLFAMLFSDRKNLLELYNAVNGTDYQDPDMLEVNTLENAIYMSMKNDVSFIIDSRMSLYEHQSTYNPNLPLRFLFYVADLYSSMTRDANLYGSKLLELDTPQFVIFYNGQEEQPDRLELRLSDAFRIPEEDPALELRAVMLNINIGKNRKLMEASQTLWGYAEYTRRIRKYAGEMDLEDAVERTITECIQEGILADFLKKNRAEAKKMSIYEYDEERHMSQIREEGREEGREKGREEGEAYGHARGLAEGISQGFALAKTAICLEREGKSPEEIAEACGVPVGKIQELLYD